MGGMSKGAVHVNRFNTTRTSRSAAWRSDLARCGHVHRRTVVLIESADRTVAAGFPPWTRRRLLAALHTAGFRVALERRWFATGESEVRPWP